MEEIKARYDEIISGLGLDFSLDDEFKTIIKTLEDEPTLDYAASRGEYLNGLVMANYLGYEFIDPYDVIFFNEEGNLNSYKTAKVLSARLEKTPKAVIPGFYGQGKDGKVKTFTRGGSDVTGSVVAAAARVDVYENWTDVSGFLLADPRIIRNPVPEHEPPGGRGHVDRREHGEKAEVHDHRNCGQEGLLLLPDHEGDDEQRGWLLPQGAVCI